MNKRFLWQTAALSIMTAVFFSASSVCLGQWNNSNSSGKTLMDVMRGKSTSSQPQPMPASYPPPVYPTPAQMTSAPMTPSVQTAAPSSFHSHNHNAQSYQTGNAKQSFIRPVPYQVAHPLPQANGIPVRRRRLLKRFRQNIPCPALPSVPYQWKNRKNGR